ncbi:MAG: inositol monophosphatase, partial [Planctomycetia bacterium]|nr:inositol monophosphatase [Planctomycetia bacterium]
ASRLAVAVRAVREAAATTLRWFAAPDLAVTEKADASPVTEADRAAERQLRRALLEAFPSDAFLGEETGAAAGTSGYEWVVDPVDGTKSFIHGVPLYATLVGCRRGGRGLVGVIAIPALGELAYAVADGGAWWSRGGSGFTRARVSPCANLSAGLLCTSDFVSFARRQDAARGDRCRTALERSARLARTWGDGYGYLLVATGRAEVMIDPLMNAWDAAAVETVVVEAGGRFSDWSGRPTIDAGEGVATNGLVHDEVLRLLAGA